MELAQALNNLLEARNLSVNAAARRWQVSREVLWKMGDGIPPQLGWLEDWARKAGEPVAHWRRLAGYPDPYDGREYLQLRRRRLAQKHGTERVGTFSFHPEVTADTPPEVIDEWLERWEADIARDEP